MRLIDGKLPQDISEALRFASKNGFLSKSLWKNHMCQGQKSWKNIRWNLLIRENLFRDYLTLGKSEQVIVLTPKGRFLSHRHLGLIAMNPPGARNLSHDIELGEIVLSLLKTKIISDYFSEAELKSGKAYGFTIQREAVGNKYPDLILRMNIPGQPVFLSLELERTLKSRRCYMEMAASYRNLSQILGLVVICGSHAIESSLKKSFEVSNYPFRSRPVLMAQSSDFLSNPSECPLIGQVTTRSLMSFVKSLSETRLRHALKMDHLGVVDPVASGH